MAVVTAHRQFGSKARVARELLRLVPADVAVWIEGFAGTAAMTIAKVPSPVEHINDLNGEVVNLFGVLRDEAARRRLVELIELTPYAQEEFETCRDAVWKADAIGADPVERARMFLVASWQGYGGKQHERAVWRLDKARPTVVTTWRGLPKRLQAVGQRLSGVHVHRKHIADLVERFSDQPSALLFLDPPYPRCTLNGHEIMYAVDMTDAEHEALARQLRGCRCRVLMTMAAGSVYSDVLADWVHTPYGVRSLANSKQTEVAISNYAPPAATLFAYGGLS